MLANFFRASTTFRSLKPNRSKNSSNFFFAASSFQFGSCSKRLNNFRPYLKAGLSTSINLNEIEGTLANHGLENFKLEKINFYYELAFGVDFYLRYFKFSPSVRGVFSIKNPTNKAKQERIVQIRATRA